MMIAMAFIMIWQMSRRRFNFHWISRRLGKNQRPTHSPSNRFCGEKADSAPERTDPSALDASDPAFVDPVMRGRTGRVCGGGSCGRPPRVSWGLGGFFVLSRVLDAFVKFLRGNYLVSGGREGEFFDFFLQKTFIRRLCRIRYGVPLRGNCRIVNVYFI